MRMFGHGQGWRSVEDPLRVRAFIEELLACHREFQLRTEGAQAVPYAGEMQDLVPHQERMTVKLLRPLPWDLGTGARFQMTFNVRDGRFDAATAFRGRREYLQYDFSLPHAYRPADRRAHPRFPFRPRENIVVLARAGDRLGLMGVLLNLSLGGLGMRIDRVLRLDSGLRMPVQPGLLDPGIFLSSIRLQNLPRVPLLELQGAVVRTEDLKEGLLLGVAFADMAPREREALLRCLALREELYPGGEPWDGELETGPAAPSPRVPDLVSTASRDLLEHLLPLHRMARRSQDVWVVLPPGRVREEVCARLRRHGFLRVEVRDSWPLGLPDPPRGILVLGGWEQVAVPGEEPLAPARRLGADLAAHPRLAIAVLLPREDPTLVWGMGPRLRFLPVHVAEEDWWIGSLEDLQAGLPRSF